MCYRSGFNARPVVYCFYSFCLNLYMFLNLICSLLLRFSNIACWMCPSSRHDTGYLGITATGRAQRLRPLTLPYLGKGGLAGCMRWHAYGLWDSGASSMTPSVTGCWRRRWVALAFCGITAWNVQPMFLETTPIKLIGVDILFGFWQMKLARNQRAELATS